MKQMSMMIDLSRCIGCKTCIVACRNGKDLIDHAEALPNALPYYLRVEAKDHGAYPNLSQDTWVVPCQHCQDPGCLGACPHGAITKDAQSGAVRIDPEKCTGCEFKAEMGVENKSVPSPCKVSCPAGLNVQGYVQLVKQGKSIIMISSELPEILRMSHRVVVMCEGRVTGILDAGEMSQESIMRLATMRGGTAQEVQEKHIGTMPTGNNHEK